MKNLSIFLSLFLLLSGANLLSQEPALPNVGLKDVRLQSKVKSLIKKIGTPYKVELREKSKVGEEYTKYVTYDKVYYFDENKFGITHVLTRKNKIVSTVHQQDYFGDAENQNIIVQGKIQLNDDAELIEERFGEGYSVRVGDDTCLEYTYYSLGVCFKIKDLRVYEIAIFEELPPASLVDVEHSIRF